MTQKDLQNWLAIVTALCAVLSVSWAIWLWHDSNQNQLLEVKRQNKSNLVSQRIESTKPFLELQLDTYQTAVDVTSTIATETESVFVEAAKNGFWRLYYGKMALVENPEVELAMKNFGAALKDDANKQELKRLSLSLTKACRISLDKSWGINAWSKPDTASLSSASN